MWLAALACSPSESSPGAAPPTTSGGAAGASASSGGQPSVASGGTSSGGIAGETSRGGLAAGGNSGGGSSASGGARSASGGSGESAGGQGAVSGNGSSGGSRTESGGASSTGGVVNTGGGPVADGGKGSGGSSGLGGASGSAGSAGALGGDACSAVEVGAGDMHSCALAGDGTVYCWGSNAEGQVGAGAASRQLTPRAVAGAGKDNVDLLVGHHVSCVKKVSGSVQCWGTFDAATNFKNVAEPRAFEVFGNDWSQMIVDTGACVLRKSDASVACWGYDNAAATTIAGFGNDVVAIDLEFRTVCAVKRGGSVMCKTDNDAPRTISGVSDAVSVGLRRDHDGLGEPEDVMVAGADGRGWYSHNNSAFRQMNLGGQLVATYNAQHHLVGALSRTGRVMLWHSAICGGFGDNNPPDDNGSTAGDRRNYTSDAPAVPTGFEMGATGELALGHEHACVIRAADASVYCWGRNVEGQIGNGKRATECNVGVGSHNPGPDGNQMTPFKVKLCP